jgi:hypothetical protein
VTCWPHHPSCASLGRTLHSLLGIPIINFLKDFGTMFSEKTKRRLATMDVLIIVRLPTGSCVQSNCPDHVQLPECQLPCGLNMLMMVWLVAVSLVLCFL